MINQLKFRAFDKLEHKWLFGYDYKNLGGFSLIGGYWIDCYEAFGTEHFETHKIINHKWLGITLKDALKEVKSDKFPSNINNN